MGEEVFLFVLSLSHHRECACMMGSVWLPPPASKGLKDKAGVLRQWAKERGASDAKARKIVGLLTVRWMWDLPLPPHTHRLAVVFDVRWYRYLFRRHIKHVLG